jgi:hypothetical protein
MRDDDSSHEGHEGGASIHPPRVGRMEISAGTGK